MITLMMTVAFARWWRKNIVGEDQWGEGEFTRGIQGGPDDMAIYSATRSINKLADFIATIKNNPAALQKMADTLMASRDALTSSILANTPKPKKKRLRKKSSKGIDKRTRVTYITPRKKRRAHGSHGRKKD